MLLKRHFLIFKILKPQFFFIKKCVKNGIFPPNKMYSCLNHNNVYYRLKNIDLWAK